MMRLVRRLRLLPAAAAGRPIWTGDRQLVVREATICAINVGKAEACRVRVDGTPDLVIEIGGSQADGSAAAGLVALLQIKGVRFAVIGRGRAREGNCAVHRR
jgi:hypothetical protein